MSESMSELIELMGVPKSAVIQESSSANTYENAVDVKAILEARKLHKVLLVTSALHMSRALALFKHQGIDAIAAPCDFSSSALAWEANTSSWQALATGLIPDVANLTSTTKSIKEMVGIAVYRLMGLL